MGRLDGCAIDVKEVSVLPEERHLIRLYRSRKDQV